MITSLIFIAPDPFVMRMVIFFLLSCTFTSPALSQYSFDKGYYINNDGERKEGWIRRLDGVFNPKRIEFKESEEAQAIALLPVVVKEFGITGEAVFIGATVNLDRSSSDLNRASFSRNPEWSHEALFLKIVVRGAATLYEYREDGLTRYFFSVNDSPIEQLVYKVFYPKSDQIAYNKLYLVQLEQSLNCDKMPQKIDVPYQLKPLTALFRKYNECMGVLVEVAEEKKEQANITINLRPGVNLSVATARAHVGAQVIGAYFSSKVTGRLGFELEIFPSFNNRNRRWSVFIEPNYRYYDDEFTKDGRTYTIKYTSVEAPVGIRRYFYFSDHMAVFLNAGLVFDYPRNSSGTIPTNFISGLVVNYEMVSTPFSYTAGIGVSGGRFLGELRFYTIREPGANGNGGVSVDFSNAALVLGYRLLR